MMAAEEDEIKVLSLLCFLRWLNRKGIGHSSFHDEKNVSQSITILISNNSSKIPINFLVEGLISLTENDQNISILLQSGIVQAICYLALNPKVEMRNLAVDVFLAMFAGRIKKAKIAFTDYQFSVVGNCLLSLSSGSAVPLSVAKARKIYDSIGKIRIRTTLDNKIDSSSESDESSELMIQATEFTWSEELISNNDEVHTLEKALMVTKVRTERLKKSTNNMKAEIDIEVIQIFELIGDCYSAWHVEWTTLISQCLLDNEYCEITSKYLVKALENEHSPAAQRIMVTICLQLANLTEVNEESRIRLANCGILELLLRNYNFNNSIVNLNMALISFNLTKSSKLLPTFQQLNAISILSARIESGNSVANVIATVSTANILTSCVTPNWEVLEKIVKHLPIIAAQALENAKRVIYCNGIAVLGFDNIFEVIIKFVSCHKKIVHTLSCVSTLQPIVETLMKSTKLDEREKGVQLEQLLNDSIDADRNCEVLKIDFRKWTTEDVQYWLMNTGFHG